MKNFGSTNPAVITSYSIHYTKLYEGLRRRGRAHPRHGRRRAAAGRRRRGADAADQVRDLEGAGAGAAADRGAEQGRQAVITSYSIHYTKLYDIKKSAADTFEIALRQNPDAQHIYIVDGDIPTTSILLEQLIELSGKHGFEPVIKHNFSAEKLFSEIGNLPKDSIIFYTLIRIV